MTRAIFFGALIAITLLSSILVVSMTMPTAEAGRIDRCDEVDDYKTLESATATQQGKKALKLSVDTCGEIPRFPDVFINGKLVFGYGWLVSTGLDNGEPPNSLGVDVPEGESGFIGVLAAIHPRFDDSNQNPNAWHTHPVVLTEVRFDGPQVSTDGTIGAFVDGNGDPRPEPNGGGVLCITDLGTSQGGISLHDDVMRLNIAENQAGINARQVDTVASFVVVPDRNCGEKGLRVDVLSAIGLGD